jgi:hypothetical protein
MLWVFSVRELVQDHPKQKKLEVYENMAGQIVALWALGGAVWDSVKGTPKWRATSKLVV